MSLLYQFGIFLYGCLIRLAALWNSKAKDWVQGRKNWREKLTTFSPPNGFDLWMHCSSLGEFEQGRPVLEGYRKQYPQHKILLTFFSPSGYNIRKNYEQADLVLYLPLDTKSNATAFLAVAKPTLSIFVKYDFWPNFLNELKATQKRAWLIAAKFHEQDQFHQWYGRWTRSSISAFEKIFLQDGPKINWYSATQQWIVGDTRIDRVIQIQQQAVAAEALNQWKTKRIFVWGSVWEKDWPLIKAIINGPLAHWQHLIAPHQIGDQEVKALANSIGQKSIRFTEGIVPAQVLLLDTIGQLASAYQLGDLAYIGGGFGAGIHNTLEPLAAGLPTFFGPKHQKFPEAAAAIQAHCGFEIANAEELVQSVKSFLQEEKLAEAQKRAKHFVSERAGATASILQQLTVSSTIED